ncbi:hypothetical protein TTRE_0000431901 [Trichuris trichiura]|uniref:Uncharacterized protein n=1 Tax=Trichuris trichiura TaxID=36087 RepID=A0A077ZBR3_TRITR|nr:hypothetical protein TTRE_0000431901 [Trichuris trichiura]
MHSLVVMKMLLCFLLLSVLTKEIVSNDQSSVSSEVQPDNPLEASVVNTEGRIGKRQVMTNPSTGKGDNLPVVNPTESNQENKKTMLSTSPACTDVKETSSSEEEKTTIAAAKEPQTMMSDEVQKLGKSEIENTKQEKVSTTDDGIKTRTVTSPDVEQQLQIPGTEDAATGRSTDRVNKRAIDVSSSTEEVPA